MIQAKAKIIKNIEVTPKYYKIVLSCLGIAGVARAGQFVMLKTSDGHEPLLRRPFSIHGRNKANIEILYEALGKGTEILSHKKTGEYLDIIGPLGRGFNYQSPGHQVAPSPSLGTPFGRRSPVLVAGGMGVAPLLFLAKELASRKIMVLLGAKTKKQILCEEDFKKLGCEIKISTDDGSGGFKGYVSGLLKQVLTIIDYRPSAIYACGPRPMLKEISAIAKKYNIAAQVSLEEHMACGIGACLGCVVNTKKGYQPVCKEGPVFEADEIIW